MTNGVCGTATIEALDGLGTCGAQAFVLAHMGVLVWGLAALPPAGLKGMARGCHTGLRVAAARVPMGTAGGPAEHCLVMEEPMGHNALRNGYEAQLAQLPFLQSLTTSEIAALAAELPRVRFGNHVIIFARGDPGSILYFILSGHVKISVSSEEGHDVTLALLGPGAFFGEMSLLDDLPRSATATTLAETELLVLPRPQFLAVLQRYPAVTREVLTVLSRRLRQADALIEDIVLRDVHARVARRLLALAEEHGIPVGDSIAVHLPLSQEELAALVGISRETLNRVLRVYRVKGWISFEGRQLYVHQPQALRRRGS